MTNTHVESAYFKTKGHEPMINRLRIGAVVLTGAGLLATSAGIAHAQATKASLKCASSELKAVTEAPA